MDADLMLLYLLYHWIMTNFHEEVKAGLNSCQCLYHFPLGVIAEYHSLDNLQ